MKRVSILLIIGVAALAACDSKRDPGKVYMPDMAYSRTIEGYAKRDTTQFTMDATKAGHLIYFTAMPVRGTMRRGDLFPYPFSSDSIGYLRSASVKNPFDSLSLAQMTEAGRLYNINCGICHGEKAGGNGPLATAGHVGGVANLTLPAYVSMADGTMFHSVTFGKGVMGSYASQLTRAQRWMVIKYVRTLQPKTGAATTAPAGTATTAAAGGTATTAAATATGDTTKK